METYLPLHVCHVKISLLIINRIHMFLHGAALMALIYYRITNLHFLINRKKLVLIFPHILVFTSELILCFLWLLDQAYRWRPVSRTVFPERLPDDDMLPSIDVLICTADPNKEPSEEVMNTVISAMALDYPPEKLHVYLSDDGGCSSTLFAMKEAWKFASLWIPFCRKYEILDQTRCPQAYFAENNEDSCPNNNNSSCNIDEFMNDKINLKKEYAVFKERLQKFNGNNYSTTTSCKNHPQKIEVINNDEDNNANLAEMPLLVYVSREKRHSKPHHFKAGALNVLVRVSGMISNSAYILVLDCDMYSNDPTSAKQAMCFHLDTKIASNLAFVQFPQKFHNISDHDIYDSEIRQAFQARWKGFDGIGGPSISGTCFYIKRIALYGISTTTTTNDFDLVHLRKIFGPSDEFIKSIRDQTKTNIQEISNSLLQMIEFSASCDYEKHSSWGKQVGFRYFSVVEDYFTGFMLKCEGSWNSVYIDPTRPSFLGSATTNLEDSLIQNTRWSTGLAEVAISKYTPLLYGPSRTSILQTMCYAQLAYLPFYFFPCWCFATIPQLCFLRDIPLYPQASNSYFVVFGFIFLSSNLKIIHEVFESGNYSIWAWVYELRIWMIRSITSYLYGSVNAILEKISVAEASFLPTNKANNDEEQYKLYKLGKYNFEISRIFITPICTLVVINSVSLIIGIMKIIIWSKNYYDQMFLQALLLVFIFVMQYPVVEGMIIRKDKGRVSQSVSVQSTVLALIILSLGYLIPL